MSPKIALVITSISGPNEVLKLYADLCTNKGYDFILIGDTRSPANFALDGCDFWSIDRQLSLNIELIRLTPSGHYARKNIGYLIAINNGNELIIETDDDNLPYEDFFDIAPRNQVALTFEETGWLNVYNYFSNTVIWPRGFPLEAIQNNQMTFKGSVKNIICPVQQGLADDNPDVDAIYRLTYPLPVKFKKREAIALGRNSWCPFNSQNTAWYKEAYALMYLPSYCSFRMTDIWRSFVAQRIAWENEWSILYHSPTVWQQRNEHDLLHNFEEEIPGYLNNSRIMRELSALNLKSGADNTHFNMIRCYETLCSMGVIDNMEMPLLKAWLKHFF